MTATKKWPRRAEFVNFLLVMAIGWGDLVIDDVEFDGVAGHQFDRATSEAIEYGPAELRNAYITLALKLDVPVEGLVADGEFGEKWAEVITLAKQVDADPQTAHYDDPEGRV